MKKHKLVRCIYSGYYKDKDVGHIAKWKCPLCKRVYQCGQPKDKNMIIVRCDGL